MKEVISLIQETTYGKAFRLLRQHKLDINLIYDVDPDLFLANIGKFVREVKKIDFLNLFVNSLVNEDRGRELEFMKPQLEEDLLAKEHEAFFAKFKEEK